MRTLATLLLCALMTPAQSDGAASTTSKPPRSKKAGRVIHELKMSGAYMDLPGAALDIASLVGLGATGKPKPFYTLVDDLAKVEGGAILVDLSDLGLSLNGPQLTELERAFTALRDRGVHATAYLENASMAHYRAAMLCDKVVLADMGMLDFRSPAMGSMFFKGVMDLLGVEVQVTRCGDFKGAVEPFLLERMSDHLKLHYEKMLTSMNDHIVNSIAARRGLAAEKVRALQKRRMFDAEAAKAAGLVDEIVPWRGARFSVATDDDTTFKNVGKKEKKGGISLMSLLSGGSTASKMRIGKDSVVVLQLSGTITDGKTASPGSMVSGPTVALIRELAEHKKVKGVVVRVNSPGGSATASEAILLALRDLAKAKPTVVSMGDLAASGGYYISMIGKDCKVFAEAETITGSIGVFGMRPNVKELADALGVHQELVTLDPDAAGMDDLFSPLSDTQLNRLQDMVDGVYTRFQDRILEARKMSREDLLKIAGGRVWSGTQAKELGLVDALGGLGAAMATIEPEAGAGHAVVHFPKPDSNPLGALGSLLGAHLRNAETRLTILSQAGFKLEGPLRILLDALRNPRANRAWMMIPAELRIR